MFRRDHELIQIARRSIDGDEADHVVLHLRDDDLGGRQELVAPALAPPVEARGEIDIRIGRLPGAQPQCDGGVFIVRPVGPQRKAGRRRHGVAASLLASLPASLPASFRSLSGSRCMASFPAAIWPLAKMASWPARPETRPPASPTRMMPAAISQDERS